MIYNLNDSYYINQAIDSWLLKEDDNYYDPEDEDVKSAKERCMPDE